MDKSLLLIVNGLAAKRHNRLLEHHLRQLRLRNISHEVQVTRSAGHASVLAEQGLSRGIRRFVVGGGDGTNFEVINGLFRQGIRDDIDISFIPMGTGNSFIRDFDGGRAFDTINGITQGDRQWQEVDVVELRHDSGKLYSINHLSFGFIPRVALLRNRYLRNLGAAGYVVAVLLNLVRRQAFDLSYIAHNGSRKQCFESQSLFVSICNSKFTGGKMLIAPEADPCDGLVEIVRAEPMSRLNLLLTFPKIYQGTHVESPFVNVSRASSIQFQGAIKQPVMADGEVFEIAPQQLTVHHRCLRVCL